MGWTEMTCREVVDLINDYLERTLPLGERARFERHLDDCPHCVVYLEQMRTTLAATGRLSEAELDARTRDELVQAFRTWRERAAGA